jgi:hypothetical protein
MKRKLQVILTIIFILFTSSCMSSQWEVNSLTTSTNQEFELNSQFNGEIPDKLKNWKLIKDISNNWFSCDYQFILRYTTLKVDSRNSIWVYGPDKWNGPSGERVPDSPSCDELVLPRIVLYEPKSGKSEILPLNLPDDSFLASARGWEHIGNEEVLLTTVFVYNSPWDGNDGGESNRYIDFALLSQGQIIDLQGGNTNIDAVPDYAISNDIFYAIASISSNEIKVLKLDTKEWIHSLFSFDCIMEYIEVYNENIILLCNDNHKYSLRIFTLNMKEIARWDVVGDRFDLPLAKDTSGRIWVGYKYVLRNESGRWVLDVVVPEENMSIMKQSHIVNRRIYGMFPYKDMMLFNLEGAIYLADYDKKQWTSIVHGAPPLPMAVGNDGVIYIFTGKYIISTSLSQ